MKSKLTGAVVLAAILGSSTAALASEATGRARAQDAEPKATDAKPDARQKTKEDAQKFGEAVGSATTTAATDLAEAAGELTRLAERPGVYDRYAVEVNPLGLIVGGRVSLNVEYVPVTHHAIVVSPHFVRTTSTIEVAPTRTEEQSFTGFGGEVGYRYYSGHSGMNGIFVGPSILGGFYSASFMGQSTGFTNVGLAADLGYKQLLADHLALGVGVGLEYLHVSEDFHDLPAGPSAIASSGLKPRLLAEIGYAF